jgi:hypothetical protein
MSVWPPILWIVLATAGLALSLADGPKKTMVTTVAVVINVAILHWGGFFDVLIQAGGR